MTDTNETPETETTETSDAGEQTTFEFKHDDHGGVATKVGSLGWPKDAVNEQGTGADGKVADVTTEDVGA